MISFTSSLIFEIDQKSFPIIGNPEADLLEEINEQRRHAACELWETPQFVSLRYKHPFDSKQNGFGEYPEEVQPSKVIIRQVDKNIVFEVMADVSRQDKDNPHKYIFDPNEPEIVIISGSIKRRDLLSVAMEYVGFYQGSEALIQEFAAAGAVRKIQDLDEQRELFHRDINRVIYESLKDQGIQIPHEELENYRSMRYLSTALTKHVIPSSAFMDDNLINKTYGLKWGRKRSQTYHIEDGHFGHKNPFRCEP